MRPSLIHTQTVEIGILDRETKDTSLNEPKGRRVVEIIRIRAQVNIKKISGTEEGAERRIGIYFGNANLYLVCYDTPETKKIKKGDLVLSINGEPKHLIVKDIIHAGHYNNRSYLLSILVEEGHY